MSPEDRIRGNNSHVKAQVLLLLKEVVQDELPDEIWVQRVVDHLGPPKLDENQSGQKKTDECNGNGVETPASSLGPSETTGGGGGGV